MRGSKRLRVYLVRHGESEANVAKIISGHCATPLTELGRGQAEIIGAKLFEMNQRVNVVYSSDLARASETVEIICGILGIAEIHFDERLREGNAGNLTGRRVLDMTEEEKKAFDNLIIDHDSRPLGGESANEQFHRTREIFLEIVEKQPEDSTVLIVGHGGTLYWILNGTLELLPPKMDEWYGNCKLNIIERKGENSPWKLTMFNDKAL